MTQMEKITRNIEKNRNFLLNLIECRNKLTDIDIIIASQSLDEQLNLYHRNVAIEPQV